MTKTILTTILSLTAFLSFSQDVKLKKEKVLVDKKEFLSYELGGSPSTVSYDIYELSSKERILVIVYNNGGTHMDLYDDYTQIKFIKSGTRAEIPGGDVGEAIKLLIKNEVLTTEGTLDETKIELFIKNYDEKISEKN